MLYKFSILVLILIETTAAGHYFRVNGTSPVELKIWDSVPDFSFAHLPPLGPLYQTNWCYSGVLVIYREKDFKNYSGTYGYKSELCKVMSWGWSTINSVRFLGEGSSQLVYLYEKPNYDGIINYYSVDQANLNLTGTGSLQVVGAGVSVTFYTLPNFGGADICVSVGTSLFNLVSNLEAQIGFTSIRSLKFGCHSAHIF